MSTTLSVSGATEVQKGKVKKEVRLISSHYGLNVVLRYNLNANNLLTGSFISVTNILFQLKPALNVTDLHCT